MLFFWIILGIALIVLLNLGYFAGFFSWKLYHSKSNKAKWLRHILWPLSTINEKDEDLKPAIKKFSSIEAYSATMAFVLIFKLLWNLFILAIIGVIAVVIIIGYGFGKVGYYVVRGITWPIRKLAKINGLSVKKK